MRLTRWSASPPSAVPCQAIAKAFEARVQPRCVPWGPLLLDYLALGPVHQVSTGARCQLRELLTTGLERRQVQGHSEANLRGRVHIGVRPRFRDQTEETVANSTRSRLGQEALVERRLGRLPLEPV